MKREGVHKRPPYARMRGQFGGLMSDTSDLTVRVLDDIVVVMAGTGFEVTYRKDGQLPMLVATDLSAPARHGAS